MRMYLPIIAALALSACGGDDALSEPFHWNKWAAAQAIENDYLVSFDVDNFFNRNWAKPGAHEKVINSEDYGAVRVSYGTPYVRDDVAALCRAAEIQHVKRDKTPYRFIRCATISKHGKPVDLEITAENKREPFNFVVSQ